MTQTALSRHLFSACVMPMTQDRQKQKNTDRFPTAENGLRSYISCGAQKCAANGLHRPTHERPGAHSPCATPDPASMQRPGQGTRERDGQERAGRPTASLMGTWPETAQKRHSGGEGRQLSPCRTYGEVAIANPWDLTKKEIEVCAALVKLGGLKLAARELGLGIRTIEGRMCNIRRKMKADSVLFVVVWWDRFARGAVSAKGPTT